MARDTNTRVTRHAEARNSLFAFGPVQLSRKLSRQQTTLNSLIPNHLKMKVSVHSLKVDLRTRIQSSPLSEDLQGLQQQRRVNLKQISMSILPLFPPELRQPSSHLLFWYKPASPHFRN
jgi:hypothetical protein